MKIHGGRDYIIFEKKDGYAMRASGELLVDNRFAVEVRSMNHWEPPHDHEPVTREDIAEIIREARESMGKKTMHLIFEY